VTGTEALYADMGHFGAAPIRRAGATFGVAIAGPLFGEEATRAEIERSIPLGRVAQPADIAGAVLFLVSDLARHVQGEVLNVNGGSVLVG